MRRSVVALLFALAAGLSIPASATAQARGATAARTADDDLDALDKAGEARAIGPEDAKVVVLEFLDFACPTCKAFHVQRADSLRRAVGADVRIVYVTFLFADHRRSWHAAEAGVCAGGTGGGPAYRAMADRLFQNDAEWKSVGDATPVFMKFARESGIDTAAFADCLARDAAAPLILSDLETAGRLGIAGTPTFVVVPRGATAADQATRVSGNVPVQQLLDMITQARAKAK